ncbi:unnamed protein product [Rhizophagus irregularis]|nr:unnamed protein product [Rhizophagus irregularis]
MRKPRISFGWCKDCETNSMKENFPYWTSENKEIDEINPAILNLMPLKLAIIWSGSRPRWNWDDGAQEWTRTGPTHVALKRLDNSLNISSSYIDQPKHLELPMDPTSNYMIVMKYYENGDLYQYLDRSNGILSWRDMIDMLWGIAGDARIGDVGLYGPCDYHENNNNSGQIYGVLPYIAPEVLRGENYTPASDIYSFGIIMNTLATERDLDLMQLCWSNELEKRPTASLICKALSWNNLFCDYDYYDEKKRYKIHPHPKIHPEAYYTSRLLYFPELSK